DHHVVVAIVIHVAGSRHVATELRTLRICGHRDEQPAVFTGVDVRLPCSRRAGDDVGDPVAIRIAGGFDAEPELIARLAVNGPQQLPRLRRIDVYLSGAVIVCRRRGDEVSSTDGTRDPTELVAGRLAVPFANDLHVLDEWVFKIGRLGK